MLRYRMHSKPRRWGWIVAIIVIALLLILISSKGSHENDVSSQPAVTQNGAGVSLLQFWSNLKAGALSLFMDLTGHGTPPQLDITLDEPDGGAGEDADNPVVTAAVSDDIQIVAATPQASAEAVQAGVSPQILIYHTHSYEAYTKQDGQDYVECAQWRTKDNNFNVAAVGEALADELTNQYGIAVLHDETDNECSQLDTAYSRSLVTAQKDLAANPGLKILIDLHRDADNSGIDPKTVTLDGKQVARVMFVIGTGVGETGVGFSVRPNWQENIKLAQAISDGLAQYDPGLTRGVDVKTGRYNQHLSTGAVLIEVGENDNTLQEALNAVPYLAQAIADAYNNFTSTGSFLKASAAPSASPSLAPTPAPSPSAPASPSPAPAVTPSPTPTQAEPEMKLITLG